MAVSTEFRDYALDQLAALEGVSARAMFGGFGVFRDGVMFALIADDTLYFKVDSQTRPAFESAGMPPFRYTRGGKQIDLSYMQAPVEILDDPHDAARWARDALAAAHRRRQR